MAKQNDTHQMTAHTPGPSYVCGDSVHGQAPLCPLHAAAPVMLAELENTVNTLLDHGFKDHHPLIVTARAAIAKAKGESK